VPEDGLSPICLKSHSAVSSTRPLALLTQVEKGDPIPDGFPPIVLQVLQQAIAQGKERAILSSYGRSQAIDLPYALKLLKAELRVESRRLSNTFVCLE